MKKTGITLIIISFILFFELQIVSYLYGRYIFEHTLGGEFSSTLLLGSSLIVIPVLFFLSGATILYVFYKKRV